MAHQLYFSAASYVEPLLKQLNLEASYPLYVIPVATVLAFALLVYAFGFKKVNIPQDSLASDQSKKGKSKPKAKSKSKGSSPQQSQVKANGSVNHQQQKQQQQAKPKAVVQPIKREKVAEKSKKNQVRQKEVDVDVTDFDSGDWVTVSSKKAAKSAEKQLAKKEKLKEAKAKSNESSIKVTKVILDEPTVTTIESAWTTGEEEPLEFEDTRALKKKQPSKKGKEKAAAKKQSEPEVATEPQKSVPEDKLTSTVIASYDSVDQKPRKKSDSKKPEVAKAESKKVSKKSEGKPVEAKGQKVDESKSVASKPLPPVEVAPVLPKLPANKVEKSSAPAPPASSSTDITDATESDPSEGEFKVVRKRKARRE